MLFKINNVDYTKYIIPGTYDINSVPEIKDWEDASGKKHFLKVRDRVKGSFNMEIHKSNEYEAFISDLEKSRNELSNVSIAYLMVNNKASGDYYNCQINVSTKRNLDGTYKDYIEQFTVEVEEQ